MRLCSLLPAASLLLPVSGVAAQTAQPAEAVYVNARVWTGDSLAPAATALAVRDLSLIHI